MKFLIAATLMCLALIGQAQAGSLRGLTVPVPHQSYGAPVLDNEIHIEETQPITEDRDTLVIDSGSHEEPMVSQPSIEYGAPAVANKVETVPFVDSLPLLDSFVNFGTPSETYLPPATPTITPKPELPHLQPGLPTLPEAPVVPIVSEERVEVSNAYLPPVDKTPSIVEEYVQSTPSEVYGPPPTAEIPKFNDVVLPAIHEIPALPEAPVTIAPAVSVESSGQYFYEPPAISFPTPINHVPEILAKPTTPLIIAEGRPSEVYGPPAHEEHKPSELYGAANVPVHIPAPVTTFVAENARPSEVYGIPATHETPTISAIPSLPEVPVYIQPTVTDIKTVPVEPARQYFYEPPAIAFPTPVSVQPITPEIEAVPVETARQYFYEVPAKRFPTPVTLPVGQGIVSHAGFIQNSASSSSSSSSLQVNKFAVPITIQPHADSVTIEELKPTGSGFTIHNSENTSTGSYKQVSVVNHLLPHSSSFGTIAGHRQLIASRTPLPVPHGAYGVSNF